MEVQVKGKVIKFGDGCNFVKLSELKPYEKNPKNHDNKDIDLIIKSIERNGFGENLLICPETNEILSGNGRYLAAKKMGLEQVPCVYAPAGLTEKQKADLVIASNKLVEISGYNNNLDLLLEEFELNAEDFGIDLSEDKPKMPKEAEIPEGYEVIVECETEEEQQQVFEQLQEKGYQCRLLTL